MDTVAITTTAEGGFSMGDLRTSLTLHWPLLKTPPDRVAIEESGSRVYVNHATLDNGDVDRKRIFLDYSSVDLVKRVVAVIGDDPRLVIDNDFNTILPGDQFVARLRSDPNWNWRS